MTLQSHVFQMTSYTKLTPYKYLRGLLPNTLNMVVPRDGPSTAPNKGFASEKDDTALQRHVAFFDRDEDGIIWPLDTYVPLKSLGKGNSTDNSPFIGIEVSGTSSLAWSYLSSPCSSSILGFRMYMLARFQYKDVHLSCMI